MTPYKVFRGAKEQPGLPLRFVSLVARNVLYRYIARDILEEGECVTIPAIMGANYAFNPKVVKLLSIIRDTHRLRIRPSKQMLENGKYEMVYHEIQLYSIDIANYMGGWLGRIDLDKLFRSSDLNGKVYKQLGGGD